MNIVERLQCGSSFKTATILIGVIDTLALVIYAVVVLISLQEEGVFVHLDKIFQVIDQSEAFENVTAIVFLVFTLIILAVAPFLIHGARKEKPALLVPWLVVYVFYLLFTITEIIGGFILGGFNWFTGLQVMFLVFDFLSFITVLVFRKNLLRIDSENKKTHGMEL